MSAIFNVIKLAGFAAVMIIGAGMVIRKASPNQSDLITGAIHFRKGINEIGKAFSTILFGSEAEADPAAKEKERESKRIIIE